MPNTQKTDWTDQESVRARIAELPREVALAVAVRAAERALPTISTATHPDTLERWNTLDAALAVVKRHLRDSSVSKFTLRQARDLSYDVADTADSAAADAVLYVASAAVEADPTRSLVECLRAAVRAMPEQANLIEADCVGEIGGSGGPLWPDGEPCRWAEATDLLAIRRPTLPIVLRLP